MKIIVNKFQQILTANNIRNMVAKKRQRNISLPRF